MRAQAPCRTIGSFHDFRFARYRSKSFWRYSPALVFPVRCEDVMKDLMKVMTRDVARVVSRDLSRDVTKSVTSYVRIDVTRNVVT